jgi:hypothetical protein
VLIPTLEVVVDGLGRVTTADRLIDCPPHCIATISPSRVVELVAEAESDGRFVRWSSEQCGDAPVCRISSDEDVTITAFFGHPNRILTATVTGEGRGSISSDDGSLSCGDRCSAPFADGAMVRLLAAADAGSVLGAWSGPCASAGSDDSCDLIMDADRQVSARFDRARFSVTVTLGGTGASAGRVISNRGAIDCPNVSCSAAYDAGAEIELSATAGAEARFDGWAGAGCVGTGACRLTVSGQESVTAIFTDITVPITAAIDGSGAGTVTSTPLGISCGVECEARFLPGERVTLIATPDASSRFHGWGEACASSGRTGSCTITAENAATVRATFHANIVRDVAFGLDHTCVLLDPDVVRCFGSNTHGQLGYGDMLSRGDGAGPPANAADVPLQGVTDLGLGNWHSCAIANGALYCWGRNEDGQLGVGDSGSTPNPNPRGPVGFAGAEATDVEASAWHTCAVVDGGVRCWGRGADGALGYGDTMSRTTPGPAISIYGGGTILDLAVGGAHTCVLLMPGRVRCWGNNDFGQLGYGDTTPARSRAGHRWRCQPRRRARATARGGRAPYLCVADEQSRPVLGTKRRRTARSRVTAIREAKRRRIRRSSKMCLFRRTSKRSPPAIRTRLRAGASTVPVF